MSETIDRKMFIKTLDARTAQLKTEVLETGNRINILREETARLEQNQIETVGMMNEIANMKETFKEKDKEESNNGSDSG